MSTVILFLLLATASAAYAEDAVADTAVPQPVIPVLYESSNDVENRKSTPEPSPTPEPSAQEVPAKPIPPPELPPLKPSKPWGQLPSLPPLPSLPSLPELPHLPSLPPLPSLPHLPSLPQLPSLPPLPSLPHLPSLPAMPSLPELPAIPQLPAYPNFQIKCKLWDWRCIKDHFDKMFKEVSSKIKDWASKIPTHLSHKPKSEFVSLRGLENTRVLEVTFDGPSRMYSFVASMPLELDYVNYREFPHYVSVSKAESESEFLYSIHKAMARIRVEIPFEITEGDHMKLKFTRPSSTIEKIEIPPIDYMMLEPRISGRHRAISPHYWFSQRAMEYETESRSLAFESLEQTLPKILEEMAPLIDFDIEGEPIDELRVKYICNDP